MTTSAEGRVLPFLPVVAPSPSLLTVARPLQSPLAPPEPIDPAAPPTPTVEGLDPGDEYWRTGVKWNQVACAPSYNEARCNVSGYTRTEPTFMGAPIQTDAFVYYTPMACDWLLRDEQILDAVTKLEEARACAAVAQALWMGTGMPNDDTQPTLRRSAAGHDVSLNTPISFGLAVARLLGAYERATGGLGGAILHVPSVLVPTLQENWLIRQVGDVYVSALGAVVSPGPGYPWGLFTAGAGAPGPLQSGSVASNNEIYAASAAGEEWVYVSGPVEYALGPPRTMPEDEAARRGFFRTNHYEVWRERLGIVRFDPCSVSAARVINPAGDIS